MDYKEVLENQIKKLQQAQEEALKSKNLEVIAPIARQITEVIGYLVALTEDYCL